MSVHRREANVCDLVEALELLHHDRADLSRRDLLFRTLLQRGLDAVPDGFERGHAHGTLLARLQQTAHECLAIEALARAILLHHHVRNLIDPFVAGEALAAFETLAAPADDLALLALARVDNLVAQMGAVGTLHDSGRPS